MIQFTIKILLFLLYILSAKTIIADDREIKVFKTYLTTLKSVAIDFSQIDSREKSASGKLIISQPYRFRINYYSPYPYLLIGNKSEIIMYDYGLEQTTRFDAKENMFNFLLINSKEWEKNFRIDNVFASDNNITAKLYNYTTDRTISIILYKYPIALKQIIIEEPDGNVIEITIEQIKNIFNPDKDLFLLPNPEIFGKPARLKKKDIEKKYNTNASGS